MGKIFNRSGHTAFNWFVLTTAVMILSFSHISYSSFRLMPETEKIVFFKPVLDKLIEKGVDSAYIYSLVTDKNTTFNEKYVKINVTGYLKKADYSFAVDSKAIEATKSFIQDNKEILENSERQTNVSYYVTAAILWIETRHGGYLGNHNLPSVFFSTAMSNQDKFVKMNIEEMEKSMSGGCEDLSEYKEKIRARAKKKSEWALNELMSMQRAAKTLPYSFSDVKGSWAGAFGISQFLPSSYANWAIDGNNDGKIDLFDKCDAIFSTANYLKSNGWGASKEAQRKAVYHYNNSSAYVDAVLELAELASKEI